ncbi:ras guanine nucleotide exchange factor domain-containing protein [Phycomyces blakesleeanus]|uniref:Ras guanine nucleotide exchange factor domain-containing protein n=1 Tax=Phycomyces blakesleeanus TaxID=4837 RepID=A0ABR3AYL7_PHYBL
MVIRIAEALRQDSLQCECATCSKIPERTQECKRISLLLHPEGDDERRHSMELRRRRGASFDRGPVFEPVAAPKEPMPTMEKRDGPLYLSYLRPLSNIHPTDTQSPHGMPGRGSSTDLMFSATTTSSTINQTAGPFDHHDGGGLSVAATQQSCVTDQSASIAGPLMPIHPTVQPSSASAPSPGRYPTKSASAVSMPSIPRPIHSLGTSMISHDRVENNWGYRSFILMYRSEHMAQQLCLIEKTVLLDVNWEEMVHCKWTKMDAMKGDFGPTEGYEDEEDEEEEEEEDLFGRQNNDINYTRRTRQIQLTRKDHGGVEQVIKRFNAVCLWVASEIVRTRQIDERVRVIEKFIRLAQKCKLFCNFATLVQILLGLQSPSVSRLRKTWSRVGTSEMKLLDQLSAFTSPMRNWKSIRDSMMMVAEEYGMSPTEVQIEMPGTHNGASKTKIKLPFGGCIPFLGIYLSDLVFNSEQPAYIEPDRANHKIYQANTQNTPISPVLKQSLVNFRKHRIIATVIKRVLTFQNLARRYSFETREALNDLCFQVDALTTEKIRELSLEIEPA